MEIDGAGRAGRRRGLRARRGDGAGAGRGRRRGRRSPTSTPRRARRWPARSAARELRRGRRDRRGGRSRPRSSAPPSADGGLRISVCCAGIGWAERIARKRGPHDLEIFSNVVKVNLIGTFNVLRLAAAAMSGNEPDDEGERGVCVNTASIAAYDGQIGQVAYAASKGGIVGMTLPAARDIASPRRPRDDDRPRPLRHAAARGAARGGARRRSAPASPSPPASAAPRSTRDLVGQIVANPMLNGETIRLDGALRMPPK